MEALREAVRSQVPRSALTKFARILSWTGWEEHGRHAATRLQRRLGMCSLLKWVQVTHKCVEWSLCGFGSGLCVGCTVRKQEDE